MVARDVFVILVVSRQMHTERIKAYKQKTHYAIPANLLSMHSHICNL